MTSPRKTGSGIGEERLRRAERPGGTHEERSALERSALARSESLSTGEPASQPRGISCMCCCSCVDICVSDTYMGP